MHPKVGEIVILEIKHSINEETQSNKKAYTNMFGYVANINITKKNKDNVGIFNNSIKGNNKFFSKFYKIFVFMFVFNFFKINKKTMIMIFVFKF